MTRMYKPRILWSVRIRRRTPIVLITGLLLGLTVMPTVASWTDSEFATGTFTASTFDTESNVNGAGYAGNHTSPGPTVSFGLPGFGAGDTKYFNVLIRTTTGSVGGTTVLNGGTLSGPDTATLGAAFVYRVVRTTATCDATAFTGTPTFVVGTSVLQRPLTNGQEVGVVNTLAAATPVLPGAPTGFCFAITLPNGTPNNLQNKSATATWQFAATSS